MIQRVDNSEDCDSEDLSAAAVSEIDLQYLQHTTFASHVDVRFCMAAIAQHSVVQLCKKK